MQERKNMKEIVTHFARAEDLGRLSSSPNRGSLRLCWWWWWWTPLGQDVLLHQKHLALMGRLIIHTLNTTTYIHQIEAGTCKKRDRGLQVA